MGAALTGFIPEGSVTSFSGGWGEGGGGFGESWGSERGGNLLCSDFGGETGRGASSNQGMVGVGMEGDGHPLRGARPVLAWKAGNRK